MEYPFVTRYGKLISQEADVALNECFTLAGRLVTLNYLAILQYLFSKEDSMQHRFLVLLVIFWASTVQAGNNAGGAFAVWPDTGLTKCYNNSVEIPCPFEGQDFHGQDAQYRGPVRSYTKLNGSGNPLPEDAANWVMVRDNVTGLIWEVKENMDDAEDYNNPHDADNRYTWCDINPDSNGGNQGACGAHDTKDFIDDLNNANFGGHHDWRLPTLKELQTLIDYTKYNPAIDTTFFPGTALVSANTWSATTHKDDASLALRVNFNFGYDSIYSKSTSIRVRAVRGGDGSAAVPFTDNGDGTVTDTVTGLMWAQASADTAMNWQQALAWCQNLELAGYTDWRLPDINELMTLADYARTNLINTTFFPDTVSDNYWSATTRANQTGKGITMNFNYGSAGLIDKSDNIYARCVRGRQFGSLVFPWPLFLPAVTAGHP